MIGKTRVKLNQATTETAGNQGDLISDENQRTEIWGKKKQTVC
jgi:hypothetical protein